MKVEDKFGFIDQIGQVVIPPRFDRVANFSEGLARVELGGKWGFADQTGKLVIPASFSEARNFAEGLAPVGVGRKTGYIDKTGNFVWQAAQFQEPPSPPPGEVQPSPVKPPQKKENLTYEDRKAWQEILKWPEDCGPDPEDLRRPDTGRPPENPSGLRFWQLQPQKYLVEVKCQVGGYNDLQLYLFYDETTAPPTSRLVQFEQYDSKAKAIGAQTETELLGYMEFHPRNQELTRFEMERGLGDAGAWLKCRINEDQGVLLEYRCKGCDDDEKYDGIPHPETFPLIFRR
ncbi:MAG: hypothetical protein A2Y80_03435 [Deltaproteobacteria bacterium RBG_13_58_19]|nr:MAG: hypothetical protein A2Y80_03435 [Deltaproteobacteria bacterium RBG_13_58_19]